MNQEYVNFKEFLAKRVYPLFGQQPQRLRNWDKQALRFLYVDYLKPHYHSIRNNPKLSYLIDEVEHHLGCNSFRTGEN